MEYIKKLWIYAKPYRKWIFLAPLLMALEVAMDLIQPYFMEHIIDVGVAQLDMTIILHYGLMMLGASIIGMVGGVGNTVYAMKSSTHFAADLRSALYRKIQTLSFSNLDKLGTGKLTTIVTNDVTQVQNALMMMIRIMIRAPLLLIGSMIMAFLTSVKLAFFMLGLLVFLLFILIWMVRKGQPLFMVVQEKLDKLNTVMQENLAGIRLVKAFVRSDHEKKRFNLANEDFMQKSINVMSLMIMLMPIMMLVMNLGIVGIVWFGGVDVVQGNFQVGELMAFINYLTRALFSLMMTGMILMQFSRAQASSERLVNVLEVDVDIKNKLDAEKDFLAQGNVVFEQVSFGYDAEENLVLEDISFSAKPGQTVAILGATGSGKSSLVHLIPRFYDVKKGKVLIDGWDVRDLDKESLRRQIGIALQESVLFSGTIMDNIRYGKPQASDEEVYAAARAAQADEFISQLPNGYQTQLGQRGVNLSGGQKQRLAIARALLIKPAILILDDSTSAVDVETEIRIQAELEKIMKGRTSFVIAQRISTVLKADKILVLDNGRISAEGTHEQLMDTSKIYKEIYDSQLGNGVVSHA